MIILISFIIFSFLCLLPMISSFIHLFLSTCPMLPFYASFLSHHMRQMLSVSIHLLSRISNTFLSVKSGQVLSDSRLLSSKKSEYEPKKLKMIYNDFFKFVDYIFMSKGRANRNGQISVDIHTYVCVTYPETLSNTTKLDL
jgi:hypothetical protein